MTSFSFLFPLLVFGVVIPAIPVLGGSCRRAGLCCTGRDSACVVQQETPSASLASEGVPRDKPCYCDHACLKLGDCCSDFKHHCGVLDCQVSAWSPWSPCSTRCGESGAASGFRMRRRHVMRTAQHGGRRCPALVQRRGCGGAADCLEPVAARDTALLLPIGLSQWRGANSSWDIRHNLRLREPAARPHPVRHAVQFQVIKSSIACRKEPQYSALRDGEYVCIVCETEAARPNLGFRCPGEGQVGRRSRFAALGAPHCHGKWVRVDPNHTENSPGHEGESPSDATTCSKEHFIFV